MKTVNAVILKVPDHVNTLTPKDRAVFLSAHARKAAQCSANLIFIDDFECKKSASGVPLPQNGFFWSISHKPGYVGGVVAESPLGIDIEKMKPVTDALKAKLASPQEWHLDKTIDPTTLFFRFWTAKEAVLKALGIGLKGFGQCKIKRILSSFRTQLSFQGTLWQVEHFFFDQHIASITIDNDPIQWVLNPASC
jgi:4'-phosphopantetheinyl transferase